MKNDYEVRGDVTAIFLNSPKHGKMEALISTKMLDRAREFPNSWYAKWDKTANRLYVHGNIPKFNGIRKTMPLHRWVTDAPSGMVVDHKNHNGLNNTEENLRVVTQAENRQNLKCATQRNKSSGIRGVTWCKSRGQWQVQIGLNGKLIYIGRFGELEKAAQASREARKKYMPYSQEAIVQ